MKEESNENASEKADSVSASRTSNAVKQEPSIRSSNSGLYHSEIASLEAGQFVSDGVLNSVFTQYSEELMRNGIHDVVIIAIDASLFLSLGHTAGAMQLCSNRLLIFPVSNNDDSDLDGGGIHWSLLVLDKWTKHGPRLIHYDSLGSRTNLPFARRLATMLNPLLPPAITRSICRWCASSAVSNKDDWSYALSSEVSAKTTERLRKSLHRGLKECQQADGGNAGITSNTVQPEPPIRSSKGLCSTEVTSLERTLEPPIKSSKGLCSTVVSAKTTERLRKSLHRGLKERQQVDGGNVPITSHTVQTEPPIRSSKGLCSTEVAYLKLVRSSLIMLSTSYSIVPLRSFGTMELMKLFSLTLMFLSS
ncbi:hypothetical protein BAE44_0019051 [Dichanthelium oligosanthes]|uniref:Ubiquitin-like protease family profile domain-containing protein n=1 Tax=Dichanthelium oligosanthes TaxID=888268 RepID=A0A1E5V4A0_9POAL|nr:hypothetical protein BAE44_0019051 [Dichanthelium oligosanthes]